MGKNLYTLQNLNCTDAGAPKAVPQSYSGVAQNSNGYINRDSVSGQGGAGIINVVNDFQWTASPQGASFRQEVPRIQLREKRLKTNAILAAAAYYLMSAAGSTGRIGDALQSGALGSAGQSLSNLGGSVGDFLGGVISNSVVGDVLNQNIESLGMDTLKPYEGLYITEDTGFKYIFPYFDDVQQMMTNGFSTNDDMLGPSTILGRTVSTIRDAAESMARLASFAEPGLYIERPKFYNFKPDGDIISFSFPLINTGWSTYDDVGINWQLAFLLAYQNNPNRRTREIIEPPCIYEVSIEGLKYMPFAYMRNLIIKYVGSRRAMELNVPGGGTITTIIPDAYMIEITMQGLVADSRNFLHAALTKKGDIVSVASPGSFNLFSELGDLIGGSI
jgi:hypothetical protein